MRKFTSVFVAATLAFGAASLVHAAADRLTPMPGDGSKSTMQRHHDMSMMFKDLNLSEEQKSQMRSIMKEGRKEMQRPSLEDRRTMHRVIASDTFDNSKAEALAEKMSAGAKARVLMMLKTQNELYNILTPEQKKQFNANFEKRLTEKKPHKAKMLTDETK